MWGSKSAKAVPFAVTPWNLLPPDGKRQHSNITFSVKADSTWREFVWDWSRADANQEENPNDYSMITAFLLETVQWPDPFKAVFRIDDFRIGDRVVPSAVEDRGAPERPGQPALSQNYPNPFNPSTRIAYRLAAASDVRVTLLDLAGRTVRVLEEGRREAGVHGLNVDGSDLPSGVYACRLEAGGLTETRRMVLSR
jgi:hypothetical protein